MQEIDKIQSFINQQEELYNQDPNNVAYDKLFGILNNQEDSIATLPLNLFIKDSKNENHPLITRIIQGKRIPTLMRTVAHRLINSQNNQFTTDCFWFLNYLIQNQPDYTGSIKDDIINIIKHYLNDPSEDLILLNYPSINYIIGCIDFVIKFEIDDYYYKSLSILLQVPLIQNDQSQLFIDMSTNILKKIKRNGVNDLIYQNQQNIPFDLISKVQNLASHFNHHKEFKYIYNEILYQYGYIGSIKSYNKIQSNHPYLVDVINEIYDKYYSYTPKNYPKDKFIEIFRDSAKIVLYVFTLDDDSFYNLDFHSYKCVLYALQFFFLESKEWLSEEKEVVDSYREFLELENAENIGERYLDPDLDQDYVYAFLANFTYENYM